MTSGYLLDTNIAIALPTRDPTVTQPVMPFFKTVCHSEPLWSPSSVSDVWQAYRKMLLIEGFC